MSQNKILPRTTPNTAAEAEFLSQTALNTAPEAEFLSQMAPNTLSRRNFCPEDPMSTPPPILIDCH